MYIILGLQVNYKLTIQSIVHLATTFSQVSASIRISRRRNSWSFEAICESMLFLGFLVRVEMLARQIDHAPWIGGGGDPKERCPENTAGGTRFPMWSFLGTF